MLLTHPWISPPHTVRVTDSYYLYRFIINNLKIAYKETAIHRKAAEKEKTVNSMFTVSINRSDGIRTHDPFVPNEVR